MRDITRLIALAIVAFTITVLAVILDNPNITDEVARRLGLYSDGDKPVDRMVEADTVVRVQRPHLQTWVGLQGFPSQTVVRFPIPRDVGLIGGQVQLDLRTQLIEHGDGLLRIHIDGQERDALVLESGTRIHKLTYQLTPSELAAGAVVVTLSGNGTTNYGQICPTNVTNLGAAIEVLPSSALLIELDRPLSGAAAIAALLPDPLTLNVSAAPPVAAWAAQWLSRQGVPAVLGASPAPDLIDVASEAAEPMSVDAAGSLTLAGSRGVAELAALRGAALPASYGRQWPLPVEALTTDLLTHTFRGSSRWSLRYKLADLPGGDAPGNLALSLRTSRLQEGNHWTLRVLLNGSLIHSANYPGTGDTLALDVALPPALQGLTNEITVTLVDNTPNQGICRAGPEAAAQLLPESRLDLSPSPANDTQTLVKALADAASVAIPPESGAGLSTAEFLTGMLDLVLPLDTEINFAAAAGSTTIEVVDGDRIRSLFAAGKAEGVGNAFLVTPSSWSRPDGIAVVRLTEAGDVPVSLQAAPNALLVTW